MSGTRLTPPRVALQLTQDGALPGDGTNDRCHGNTDGVRPNDRAIIAHVQIVVICWGRYFENHPDALTNATALCKDLVSGRYFNQLTQYGVGRGSVVASDNIDDAAPPNTLSEDEARDRLLGFLDSPGTPWPLPAVNEDSLLYLVFLPPETKPTISSGKDDFCGYHNWHKKNSDSKQPDLFYAIIRTDKASQSSGARLISDVSACVSHEIAEGVTSRDGRGWHNGDCEIGDLCEQNKTFTYGKWQVEQYWSNWDAACTNGDRPVSLRTFLASTGDDVSTGLRALGTSEIGLEYMASRFR